MVQVSSQASLLYERLSRDMGEIEAQLTQLQSEADAAVEERPLSSQSQHRLEQTLKDLETVSNTHFVCEEQGLFPILEKHHPMVLMEKEHDLMTQLRQEVYKTFQAMRDNPAEATRFKQQVDHFASEMRRHLQQEEKGIYRIAERDLSPQEKEQAVRTMDELRTRAGSGLIYSIQRKEAHFYPFKSPQNQPLSKPLTTQKLLEHEDVTIKQIAIRAGEIQNEQWAPTRSIVLCQRGRVTCSINNEELPLETGAGILIEPGLVPIYKAKEDSDLLFIIEAK